MVPAAAAPALVAPAPAATAPAATDATAAITTATTEIGEGAVGFATTQDEGTVVVLDGDGTLTWFQLPELTPIATTHLAGPATALAVAGDGSFAYVTHGTQVTRVNMASHTPGASLDLGDATGPVAITPDGRDAFVAVQVPSQNSQREFSRLVHLRTIDDAVIRETQFPDWVVRRINFAGNDSSRAYISTWQYPYPDDGKHVQLTVLDTASDATQPGVVERFGHIFGFLGEGDGLSWAPPWYGWRTQGPGYFVTFDSAGRQTSRFDLPYGYQDSVLDVSGAADGASALITTAAGSVLKMGTSDQRQFEEFTIPDGVRRIVWGKTREWALVQVGGTLSRITLPAGQTRAGTAPMVYVPVAPSRVYDSRWTGSAIRDPFRFGPVGPLLSGDERRVAVDRLADLQGNWTHGGGEVPPNATAVAYTITVTDTTDAGYLSATSGDRTGFGAENARTSVINWSHSGETVANSLVGFVRDESGDVPGDARFPFLRVTAGGGGSANVVIDVAGYYVPERQQTGAGAVLTSIPPQRAYDSRLAGPGAGRIPAGGFREVNLGGSVRLPDDVSAVVVNVTAVDTGGPGYLALTPGSAATYASSTVNWSAAGDVIANSATVGVGADKRLKVFAGPAAADVVLDVVGYFRPVADDPGGARFYPAQPARVYDSREPSEAGPIPVPGDRRISVANRIAADVGPGRPVEVVAPGARAVAMNVTVADTRGAGYLSVNPGDAAGYTASTINWAGVGDRAHATFMGLDQARRIRVFGGGSGSTDLVLDVLGTYR